MQINQIEPKFKELEEGVEGAMLQIGALEKRLEQLASAHNTRLASLEETEHSHEEDPHVSEEPVEATHASDAGIETADERVSTVQGIRVDSEDPKTHPDVSDTSGRFSPSPNDEASAEPNPAPTEESEDTDARFRPEPKEDDPRVVKVDIQTNLRGPERAILEQAVAEKIAELTSKTGIDADIEILMN